MKKAAGCALLAGMTLAFTTTARADLVLPFEETVVVTGREMTCAFALKELNEIVKRATGKTFKAKVEGEPRTAHRIFLGRSAEAGTLWAVYDFVEDNLGYRWYQLCRDDLREQNEIVERRPTVVWKGEKTRKRRWRAGISTFKKRGKVQL